MIPDFRKKKNPYKNTLLALGWVLVSSLSILMVIANIKVYYKRKELISRAESLQNTIKEIKLQNDNLKQGIEKSDDASFIEKVAREELGLQKAGEKVVSFIMPPKQQSQNKEEDKNLLQIWLGWLGNSWQWLKDRY